MFHSKKVAHSIIITLLTMELSEHGKSGLEIVYCLDNFLVTLREIFFHVI